ncbi:MAG: hypothetical protein IPJ77_05465 [Planctomycetes bacterium]|nr:hypothetical protein [Planctomycetota bacterium]
MLQPATLATLLALSLAPAPIAPARTAHPAHPAQSSAAPAALFPIAKEDLTIHVDRANPEASTTLAQLLDEFSRVTGVTLQMNRETRGVVEKVQPGLNRTMKVPASEVVRIVETLMIANDFIFLRTSDKEPRLWIVQSLHADGGRGSSTLRDQAVSVDEKDLPLWTDHPAALVTTTIDLPNTDVRTLSNSMRMLFTDARTQQIIPVGSNSLILTGFAPSVRSLVRLLRTIDGLSRVDPAAQPPSVEIRAGAKGK